ncbi:hypothetical protein RZS08_43980, partial [Arthrospira platensis SPKY1]|nr:hypothetical protein [Arthrospira platensis SPKY1]
MQEQDQVYALLDACRIPFLDRSFESDQGGQRPRDPRVAGPVVAPERLAAGRRIGVGAGKPV